MANEMNDNVRADAQILPFYLRSESDNVATIRGRFASVGFAANSILGRHDYPLPIASLQAEALALAACLASTMKFDGVFTLQAKGDGAVKTLFADITSEGDLRGYCGFDADLAIPVEDDVAASAPADVPALMGGGYIAFTVDGGATAGRYQGIVELDGPTLGHAAISWFANSEQLDTSVACVAGKIDGEWQASAMMLQRIAVEGGSDASTSDKAHSDDAWHTARTLMESVKREEMLDPTLAPADLIYRLFNSMEPHVSPARDVRDQCRCSLDKVQSMLSQLDAEEVNDLADDDGYIGVVCEFCKTDRKFHKQALAPTQGTS